MQNVKLFKFRQATKADLNELCTLEASIFFDDAWSEKMLASYLMGTEVHNVAYVLHDDKEILAYVIVQKLFGELEVMRLAVAPTRRHEGFGKELMNRLIDLSSKLQITKIILEVNAINYKAINLYKSLGFIEVGRRRDYYAIGEDALLMDLNIT